MITRREGLRVVLEKKILLFLLGFAIEIKDRITVDNIRERELGIIKIVPPISQNLFFFGLFWFKGKKRLELLEVLKSGKVNLSILGRTTGRWHPILKKQLAMPESIQI